MNIHISCECWWPDHTDIKVMFIDAGRVHGGTAVLAHPIVFDAKQMQNSSFLVRPVIGAFLQNLA